MVLAILAGRKTQTRRICKPLLGATAVADVYHRPDGLFIGTHLKVGLGCGITQPFPSLIGLPGDRMWVRETWGIDCTCGSESESDFDHSTYCAHFRCDITDPLAIQSWAGKWHPSIHMPHKYSRITLEITDVRVQRLQDLTEEDAEEEGIDTWHDFPNHRNYPDGECNCGDFPSSDRFSWLWDSINVKRCPWSSNPFVWALTFKMVKP